ncbi:MAG: glycoside hydrolase family 13 protein [Anaerolineales bacterium]
MDNNDPETFANREKDWRNGAIVYQVLVDRFAPPADLDSKRGLYPAPKRLRDWSEEAKKGGYLPDAKLYSHEIDFWGGDFESLRSHLDYIQQLGADVLYLNPIHLAYSNHKYDASDFKEISPEFGTKEDFARLVEDVHARGMKLVLDGVFNHMGRNAPIFREAFQDPNSPWREWFAIGPQFDGGARIWSGAENLPELNLENQQVRDYIYERPDSVVRSYLRAGVDGWRLDVAFELGYDYLRDLTQAAHLEKPGSLVVGEIVNYPDQWLRSIDAVMNFPLLYILQGMVKGSIAPTTAGRMIDRMIQDSGIESMLKSWALLDNHDRIRLATVVPEPSLRRMAQTLQFTVPGAPNLYYGSELGMTGGDDPGNRSPMRWDWVRDDNPELAWIKKLIGLRKAHRALRIGDFRLLESDKLLAFERYTDRTLETVIVLANPTADPITEHVMIPHASLMDDTPVVDILSGTDTYVSRIEAGFVTVKVPPQGIQALMLSERPLGGYSRYKRVR